MLYVSNNITPEMLPFDFDRYKSIEGKRVKRGKAVIPVSSCQELGIE